MDWKEVLGGLADSLPAGDDMPQNEDNKSGESNKKGINIKNLRVFEERKGRKGKTATIIEGFTCSDDELQDIAARLKRQLGCGGSARCGEILLQGAVKERALEALRGLFPGG